MVYGLLRDGRSQREVEELTGIPRRTLRDLLKTGSTTRQLGRKPVLTKHQEDGLKSRIIRLAEIGMPLTPKSLRRNVQKFIELNRIDFRAKRNRNIVGEEWYLASLKHHPRLSKRKAQV